MHLSFQHICEHFFFNNLAYKINNHFFIFLKYFMHWVPGRRAHVVVIHQYFIVFFRIQLKKLSIALENVLFQCRNCSLNVALFWSH